MALISYDFQVLNSSGIPQTGIPFVVTGLATPGFITLGKKPATLGGSATAVTPSSAVCAFVELGNGFYTILFDAEAQGADCYGIVDAGASLSGASRYIMVPLNRDSSRTLTALPAAAFGTPGGLPNLVSESGTAQAGSATTITLRSGASGIDGFYVPTRIDITAGTGAGGQSRTIMGYAGATKVATVDSPWAVVPDSTSVYSITYTHQPGVGANGQVLVPYPPANVGVTAYAAGPAVTVSNAAPIVNIMVERGSDDPIPFSAKDSRGSPINLSGVALLLLVKANLTDDDSAALMTLSNVSAGGITVTDAVNGLFTVSPPRAVTSDTTKFPDRAARPYSIKAFASQQTFVVRGLFTVSTETVLSTVTPV